MTTEKQQSLREKREAVVLEHVQAENRHDVAASVATFHTPCYRVMPMGIVHDGGQAVGELLFGIFKGFPDFTVDIDKTYHSDDAVILDVRIKVLILVIGLDLKPRDDRWMYQLHVSLNSMKTD